ncbi:MAG TPA: MmcQ/YjbR family DNA-binding protein [Actinomycetes bacterium]|nr:MmcQ/YjbR family DNA-binding protein [Actinomycetes bacterium]
MATWDDVRRLALALPQTVEEPSREGLFAWGVKGKTFAWERPLRRADLEALGDAAPQGPILAARVPDLGAREALLADDDVYFTTPHFDGYPAILVRLDRMPIPELEELLVEAWLACAPKRLAAEYLNAPR